MYTFIMYYYYYYDTFMKLMASLSNASWINLPPSTPSYVFVYCFESGNLKPSKLCYNFIKSINLLPLITNTVCITASLNK